MKSKDWIRIKILSGIHREFETSLSRDCQQQQSIQQWSQQTVRGNLSEGRREYARFVLLGLCSYTLHTYTWWNHLPFLRAYLCKWQMAAIRWWHHSIPIPLHTPVQYPSNLYSCQRTLLQLLSLDLCNNFPILHISTVTIYYGGRKFHYGETAPFPSIVKGPHHTSMVYPRLIWL